MAYDEDLADRIRDVLTGETGVSEKAMFGGLAFLRNGNMAVAANREGHIMVRVPREQTEEILGCDHVEPMVMSGREIKGWVHVDKAGLAGKGLGKWVRLGWDHAGTLPPK
ncbi:TfoX/Sxy family protein [Gordonia sp. (in: high G+C Gram-positive bacteria)]|jgi:hypothetical protein|uniref:TfoX/Sxy family protein n=1 Tax=Gordonia sp. (in: high G+C Gram-positive bacteria) TaxID=84139 RepID=UPI001DF8AB23|nr:TfoX/Sxy family protein [Gordonia sp. (in: high G+C Gram-positive bacteria)]MCB1294244.1 TfoX/Sxy family protein [Gordonia sp. (in: high G+C Gram-positive bacteria)]HMS76992.1 TfoX/Sxy family protein [Gordonia sp. (in: high G+C Gram-positive bacteria)]HQV17301.1 TfoX/Sxy family protein [Gordonia sp. (in: high G+C Gram-positive bacteria)]